MKAKLGGDPAIPWKIAVVRVEPMEDLQPKMTDELVLNQIYRFIEYFRDQDGRASNRKRAHVAIKLGEAMLWLQSDMQEREFLALLDKEGV